MAEDRTGVGKSFVAELDAEMRVAEQAPQRPADLNRLEARAGRHASAEAMQHFFQGRAEGDLHQPRLLHPPAELEHDRPPRGFRAARRVPVAALRQNRGDRRKGEHIAHDRRPAVQSFDGRIGRLRAHLSAPPFQRFQQGGLLPADIGARALHDLDLKPASVVVEHSGARRERDRLSHRAKGRGIFVPTVEVAPLGPDGARADQHAFDQAKGIPLHDHAIAVGAGIALIRVRDHILPVGRLLLGRLPLLPDGESGAAPPAKPRALHLVDDVLWAQQQGPLQTGPAAQVAITRERERHDLPEIGEGEALLLGQKGKVLNGDAALAGENPIQILATRQGPSQAALRSVALGERLQEEGAPRGHADQFHARIVVPGFRKPIGSRRAGRGIVGEIDTGFHERMRDQ